MRSTADAPPDAPLAGADDSPFHLTLRSAFAELSAGRPDHALTIYREAWDSVKFDSLPLRRDEAQVGIAAAPMTYAIDGVQYVAILAAPPLLYVDPKVRTGPGRLLVFALDGKATLAPPAEHVRASFPPPPIEVKATVAEIREGGGLYAMYCRRCHNPGFNLVKSGAIPDLRRSSAATHLAFGAIVRGGARRALGMPSFANDISADQARLLQAFILDQQRQAAIVSKP